MACLLEEMNRRRELKGMDCVVVVVIVADLKERKR